MKSNEVRFGCCILACDMEAMVHFYRDTLELKTEWDGSDFAEFHTASGALSFWLYSRKAFAQAFNENYALPSGINQTFEIAFWLPDNAAVGSHPSGFFTGGNPKRLSPVLFFNSIDESKKQGILQRIWAAITNK